MPKSINHLNLSGKELRNALIHKLESAPTSPAPVSGQIYYNTTSNHFFIFNGTSWQQITGQKMTDSEILTAIKTVDGAGSGLDSDLLDGQSSAHYLARTNHNGTQTASTISDFDTQVRTNRLDQMAVPTNDVSLGGKKITNLAQPDGTNSNEAANVGYVVAKINEAVQGLDVKQSVIVATVSNFSVTPTYQNFAQGGLAFTSNASDEVTAFDGVTVSAGNRILVRHFTGANEYMNGFYTVANTNPLGLVRVDFFQSSTIPPNVFVFVEQGSTLADTGWVLSSNSGTVGTNPITFTQFSSAGIITAGAGLVKSGNTLSLDTANGYGVRKKVSNIGNGTLNPISYTHSLNTQDVNVSVIDNTTNELVLADVVATDVNNITITFDTAPTNNQYRVVVIG
jgi:hypothetical protein